MPKSHRKIRIFSLSRKNNILVGKKSVFAGLVYIPFILGYRKKVSWTSRHVSGSPRVLGFLGIQYTGVFNFRYTVFIQSWLIWGIKYTVVSIILVFYTSFRTIFGILEGVFLVFWYSNTPPNRPWRLSVFSGSLSEALCHKWVNPDFWTVATISDWLKEKLRKFCLKGRSLSDQ